MTCVALRTGREGRASCKGVASCTEHRKNSNEIRLTLMYCVLLPLAMTDACRWTARDERWPLWASTVRKGPPAANRTSRNWMSPAAEAEMTWGTARGRGQAGAAGS